MSSVSSHRIFYSSKLIIFITSIEDSSLYFIRSILSALRGAHSSHLMLNLTSPSKPRLCHVGCWTCWTSLVWTLLPTNLTLPEQQPAQCSTSLSVPLKYARKLTGLKQVVFTKSFINVFCEFLLIGPSFIPYYE